MTHTALVVGGSSGIGLAVARALAQRGEQVIVTSRDAGRAADAARQIGAGARGIALDLAQPHRIAASLTDIGVVDHLVIGAIERDLNSVKDYDIERALRLVTIKMVGYTEVVHALAGRFAPQAAIVLYGGQARERPYPGSTTVTTINGGVSALVRTLAVELAPLRVNAIHPGIVGDNHYWASNQRALDVVKQRTPIGRLVTEADCVGATLFLLDNRGVNAQNLVIDGGWMTM